MSAHVSELQESAAVVFGTSKKLKAFKDCKLEILI